MIKKRTDENGKLIFEEVSTDSQSSIELGMTAAGKITWKAKVYADKPEDVKKKLKEFCDIATKQAQSLG